jgi:hypothetical protein
MPTFVVLLSKRTFSFFHSPNPASSQDSVSFISRKPVSILLTVIALPANIAWHVDLFIDCFIGRTR